MERTNLWASFLAHEKLTPARAGSHIMTLVKLCEEMAKTRGPLCRPYAARLETRRFVCATAMELGIDLTGIKFRGRLAMGSGLLAVWNKVYQAKFGSTIGTSGRKERSRRDIVSKLSKE